MSYRGSPSSGIELLFELICVTGEAIYDFFAVMTITKREVVFSILIIGVLSAVGFYAASSIEKSVIDKQLAYRQAVQIADTNEFAHAMKTDVGFALVEGDLHTPKPVSMAKCDGTWLRIVASYQEYRMHTQHYTTTDSKGHVHHHTRHYWSWDTYDVKKAHADEVNFCGSTFMFEEFDYKDVKDAHHQVVDNGFHKRIVFNCLPKDFHATISSRLYDNSIHDKPVLLEGMDLAEAYEYYTTSHAVAIFWCCWVVFMILVCLVFYRFENEWLED